MKNYVCNGVNPSMSDANLINNLWVIICALLVFIMTVAVGLLEVGELGKRFSNSLYKTLLISGIALFNGITRI